MESAADFGTGLRAHLGLEQAELALLAAPEAAPEELAVDEIDDVHADEIATAAPDPAALDALDPRPHVSYYFETLPPADPEPRPGQVS